MADLDPQTAIQFEKRGKVAIITLNAEKKLNAMNLACYFRIAKLLYEIAEMPDIVVTVVTGKGRYFSAGADVSVGRPGPDALPDPREHWLRSFVANNLHITHAFYTHPKILIFALNGPAVGLSAAIVAHADFVYAAPHAFILTPFSSLGLVAEGGASRAFVERMGISKANEALLMSKRIVSEELLACGFVNKIFEQGGGDRSSGKGSDSAKFLEAVLAEVDDKLIGGHLVDGSLLGIKALIRKPGMGAMDRAGLDEVWGGLKAFMSGVPQKEFAKIADGSKKHKL